LKTSRDRRLLLLIVAVFLRGVLPQCAEAQAPQYAVTILGSVGGDRGDYGYAINDAGEVAGISWSPDNFTQYAVRLFWFGGNVLFGLES
jgi:hypothetical protein